MTSKEPKQKTFILRLSEELHRKLKIKCVTENISMQGFVLKILDEALEKDKS